MTICICKYFDTQKWVKQTLGADPGAILFVENGWKYWIRHANSSQIKILENVYGYNVDITPISYSNNFISLFFFAHMGSFYIAYFRNIVTSVVVILDLTSADNIKERYLSLSFIKAVCEKYLLCVLPTVSFDRLCSVMFVLGKVYYIFSLSYLLASILRRCYICCVIWYSMFHIFLEAILC